MKDVTITVAKSDKGYRVIVNDDTVTAENAAESKSNDSAFTMDSREDVAKKIQDIISHLE
jgi:hypothetical protein